MKYEECKFIIILRSAHVKLIITTYPLRVKAQQKYLDNKN